MYSFFIARLSYNFCMFVYIEYAVIDNMVINFLLIKTAVKICKIKTKFLYLFLSALLGTVFAILIPFFNLSDFLFILIKITIALLMTLIGGQYPSFKKYLFTFAVFLFFTFLCGGFLIFLFNLAKIDYESYFTLNYDSLLPVGITALILYLISKLTLYLVKKVISYKNLTPFIRECVIVINKKKFVVKGFIDSGNGLYDKKSGLPVIVCSNSFFENLKDINVKKSVSDLEFDTVSGSSTMKLYVIDKLMIFNGVNVNIFNNVLLGVSPFGFNSTKYQLLLHPFLIG